MCVLVCAPRPSATSANCSTNIFKFSLPLNIPGRFTRNLNFRSGSFVLNTHSRTPHNSIDNGHKRSSCRLLLQEADESIPEDSSGFPPGTNQDGAWVSLNYLPLSCASLPRLTPLWPIDAGCCVWARRLRVVSNTRRHSLHSLITAPPLHSCCLGPPECY